MPPHPWYGPDPLAQLHARSINWGKYKPMINTSTLLLTKGPSANPDREPTCCICYDNLTEEDETLTHSTCSHVTHVGCLKGWQQQVQDSDQADECPMCRQTYTVGRALKKQSRNLHSKFEDDLSEFLQPLKIHGEDVVAVMRELHSVDSVQQIFHDAWISLDDLLYATTGNTGLNPWLERLEVKLLNSGTNMIKTIRGEAEDEIINGRDHPAVKNGMDIKWQRFRDEVFRDLHLLRAMVRGVKQNLLQAATAFVVRLSLSHDRMLWMRFQAQIVAERIMAPLRTCTEASALEWLETQTFCYLDMQRVSEQSDFYLLNNEWYPEDEDGDDDEDEDDDDGENYYELVPIAERGFVAGPQNQVEQNPPNNPFVRSTDA